jgi:hypothetical protein
LTPGYYFDIRDHAGFSADDEGVELPDIKSAGAEAAISLAAMDRDAVCPGEAGQEVALQREAKRR